jgi:hypothetical protein
MLEPTPDDGQWTCPKHVEYFIKQIWEIVHLVGFHYKKVLDDLEFEFRQKYEIISFKNVQNSSEQTPIPWVGGDLSQGVQWPRA